MITPIRGKVARVLNDREIALNVGTVNGVSTGMYFDVVDTQYENILDPDTKEVLGSFERPKVRVKVTYVQEKVAIATTFRYRSESMKSVIPKGFDNLGPFARSLMPSGMLTQYETLKKEGRLGPEPKELDEEDSYVRTGDPVVQVIEKKTEDAGLLTDDEDDSDLPF